MKTQPILFHIFQCLFPAECCCDFSLTLPHLAQVFVFAVLSRLTHGSPQSGYFHYQSEKDYLVFAYLGTLFKQGIEFAGEIGQLQTKQSFGCHFCLPSD